MKLLNKAFLLYDALAALFLISIFTFFFMNFISLLNKQEYYYNIENEAIKFYKESLYNYKETGRFLSRKNKDIYTVNIKDKYCVYYKWFDEEKSICF